MNKYYIFVKRNVLEKVSEELINSNLALTNLQDLEDDEGVIIVYSEFNKDIEEINQDIILGFDKKRIKLNKFWITEDTLETLKNKNVNKLYDQGKSKYKVLARFIKIENKLVVIAMPLSYMSEAIAIINKFNIFITIIAIFIIVGIVVLLSKKIVGPLENLKSLSNDISLLNFRKIDIKTNDEIEDLSNSINKMSQSLEMAHNEIKTQNKGLKQLLSDISHELKTPLALIKVYSQGIEDGLDDGTYIETIKEQVDKMNLLIEKLLFWARIDNKRIEKSYFDLGEFLKNILKKYKLILSENNIKIRENFDLGEKYTICADKDAIEVVLDNLITNSIKYSYDKEIHIVLTKDNENMKFSILNGIGEENIKGLENIWRPFYVLEKSRNKNLSGTGLGLSIVKGILENHELKYGCIIKDLTIEFYILF